MAYARATSLLLACFFGFVAYKEHDPAFVVASLFLVVMAWLSFRNAGATNGPYVFVAVSAASLFYSFLGLSSGKYSWRNHTVALEHDPELYWVVFIATSLLGFGVLAYAYVKRTNHAKNG